MAALLHQPSTCAFCHRTSSSQVVKKNPRSLEFLKFKKSEIAVTHIQILIYYSTFMQTKASQSKSFRDENLRSSVPPPIVRSELGGSWRRLSEKQIQFSIKTLLSKYFFQPNVCQVRVTVDLPTFCLVNIFSVESKELELELEQPKKNRHPKKIDQLERTCQIHSEKIR